LGADPGFGVRGVSVNVNAVTGARGEEPGRWRTFGERRIYDSPWVQLGQVDVELPDGGRYWHHVVRLHRAAMLALVDGHDRVLLVWRHRIVPGRWGWEIPGGLVDGDEQSADAARRELEEETGYRAGQVEHLVTFQPVPGTVDAEHAVFVGREPERIGEPAGVSEITRAEWVPMASVPGLIASADIWDAGSLVALLRLLVMRGAAAG
jgi:8-oxo-dGTP pyrophosphatase MutT (NUDIX family)